MLWRAIAGVVNGPSLDNPRPVWTNQPEPGMPKTNPVPKAFPHAPPGPGNHARPDSTGVTSLPPRRQLILGHGLDDPAVRAFGREVMDRAVDLLHGARHGDAEDPLATLQ
jgi:hypothetical protein